MAISIIVPVLNEAPALASLLRQLRVCSPSAEIIVVDGGSTDDSVNIARELADKVLVSAKGRALQMNAGASNAAGNVLWFVHADSTIDGALGSAIETALSDPQVVGGCFRLRLASDKLLYRVRDAIGNLLVNLTGIALGDRGIFCRREAFCAMGGYAAVNILEDADLYRRLKRCGRMIQLNERIGSSVRRYEALGPLPTMLFYSFIMLLYTAGTPIPVLERKVQRYMARRARNGNRGGLE